MPLQYDINKVFFLQEAMAKGRAEGRMEVIESIIAKMISANIPLSTIQAITDIPIEKIRKLGNIPEPETRYFRVESSFLSYGLVDISKSGGAIETLNKEKERDL